MTTIQEVVNALDALSVDGVTRKEKYPVTKINSADLPFQFLMFPSGEYIPVSTCDDTNFTVSLQIAIATEAVSQNLYPTNYANVVAMADSLNTALQGLTVGYDRNWTITTALGQGGSDPLFVAGVAYYGVYATVTVT